MSDLLLPSRFLFRFSVPCLDARAAVDAPRATGLDERYRLPSLAELEGRAAWADVRAAWSPAGLAFSVRVAGKQQPAWCRDSRPEDSDGLQVWIDTRDVHNVHRAGRFCHRFIFLPRGGGRRLDEPVGRSCCRSIARGSNAGRSSPGRFKSAASGSPAATLLEALLPAEALTGFDPQEHPRLGFTYAVLDRELGEQTLGVGSPMPYQEDPSLWATLELVR